MNPPATDQPAGFLSHRSIALLTDGYSTPFLGKTAISLLRYRGDDVVAVLDAGEAGKTAQDLFGVGADTPVVAGLHELKQVDAVYVGIAPPGGKLPPEWRATLQAALTRGLDIVSGLHDFLQDDASLAQQASESGSRLIDVRKNNHKSTAGHVAFRPECVRIHTVGHDCSVGKMVVSLEVAQGLQAQGRSARFLATGQTGIMIAGEGIPIDCVVADFVNGAAEKLVADNQEHEFLLVEGQGSISHPSFSAVTLGLLHGCAAQGLIFCYEAGRTNVKGLTDVPIPRLEDQIQVLESIASLRHPSQVIGIAVNTRTLDAAAAAREVAAAEEKFGLPACDVYRFGADKLVSACCALRQQLLDA